MSRRIKCTVLVLLLLAIVGIVHRVSRPTPDELFRAGWQALRRGDFKTVARSLEQLRQYPSHLEERRLLRGALLVRTGEYDVAANELSRISPSSPRFEEALLLACEAYYARQQWLDAKVAAQAVLDRSPNHPDAHRWLGAIYYDLGATQAAENHLQRLSQLVPTDYSPQRLLGLIHKDFGRLKEAIAAYQAALERRPPDRIRLEICRELARCQIQQNDFAGAMKTIDFPQADQDIEIQMLRAECLWTLDHKDDARRMLQGAMQSTKDSPAVLRLAARFAVDEGKTLDALPLLEKLTSLDPFDHQVLFDLSLAYRRVGNMVAADHFLERRNAVFSLMERMSDLNMKAIREPSNADVREELASVCEQLGKHQLATAWRQAENALRGGRFQGAAPHSERRTPQESHIAR